jgi:hypothetical protein
MRYFLMIFSVPVFAIEWLIGIPIAIIAIFGAEIICIFGLKKDGNLRQPLRAVFQPRDNPAIGDDLWKKDNPTYSDFDLASSYIRRNAAYGYQSLVAMPVGDDIKIFGNPKIHDGKNGIAGWYFAIDEFGVWQWVWIRDNGDGTCWRGEYGWSVINYSLILKGSLNLVFIARKFNFKVTT